MAHAQDLSNPLGKIHRVNDDGSVPKDNPFVNRPGAVPTIWSYGHRNPQGLAWDPVTGKLWESEHGPQGGDEINIIEPGRNYGWGVITSGSSPASPSAREEGMEQPIVYCTPTIAPSGIVFYTGTRYPGWKNNLFVSGSRRPAAPPARNQRRQGHAPGSRLQPVRPRARRRSAARTAISTWRSSSRAAVVAVDPGHGRAADSDPVGQQLAGPSCHQVTSGSMRCVHRSRRGCR